VSGKRGEQRRQSASRQTPA